MPKQEVNILKFNETVRAAKVSVIRAPPQTALSLLRFTALTSLQPFYIDTYFVL